MSLRVRCPSESSDRTWPLLHFTVLASLTRLSCSCRRQAVELDVGRRLFGFLQSCGAQQTNAHCSVEGFYGSLPPLRHVSFAAWGGLEKSCDDCWRPLLGAKVQQFYNLVHSDACPDVHV